MVSLDIVSLCMMLFADDIVLVADSERNLQKLLDTLGDYLDRKKLELNVDKTVVLVFLKCGRLEEDLNFSFKGKRVRLEEVIFRC